MKLYVTCLMRRKTTSGEILEFNWWVTPTWLLSVTFTSLVPVFRPKTWAAGFETVFSGHSELVCVILLREKAVRNESLIENHESWQLHVIVDCTCCILDIILSGSNFSFMHINSSDQSLRKVISKDSRYPRRLSLMIWYWYSDQNWPRWWQLTDFMLWIAQYSHSTGQTTRFA